MKKIIAIAIAATLGAALVLSLFSAPPMDGSVELANKIEVGPPPALKTGPVTDAV